MGIGGEDAQAGTGGIDGDTANLTTFEITDTERQHQGDLFHAAARGLPARRQLHAGRRWTGVTDDGDDQENIVGLGGDWVGVLGPVDLTVSTTGILGQNEDDGDSDDLRSWEVGALPGFGGLSAGTKYGQETDFNEGDFFNAGLAYGFGGANVSVGYVRFNPDRGRRQQPVRAQRRSRPAAGGDPHG